MKTPTSNKLVIKQSLKVGEILAKERQRQKIKLADVEQATKIRRKYLIKIEASNYTDLENSAFVRGFIRQYAKFLHLDSNSLTRQYIKERGEKLLPSAQKPKLKVTKPIITPKLLIISIIGIATIVVGGYLFWQLIGLISPPKLIVTKPNSDQVISNSIFDISGHVDPGIQLYLDNSSLLVDMNGNFQDKLVLQPGLNRLEFKAKNKLGKTTTITRNILVNLPATTKLPSVSFNGVAVQVGIKDQPVFLTISVDGAEVFKGTMLAATSQVLIGTDSIKIISSNPADLNIFLTNMIVANRVLKIDLPKELKLTRRSNY